MSFRSTVLLSIAATVALIGCAAPESAPEVEVEPVAEAVGSKLMHCFAFTAVEEATDEDWQGFYAATDALPSQVESVDSVTHGRLTGANPGDVDRDYGVCMAMADEAARAAYAEDPAHDVWVEAYAKVRVPGTTTFDYLSETAVPAVGADSKLMHCFAFTAVEEATDEDWAGFYAATDALPSQVEGLNSVSHGKLTTPNVGDAHRDYGVCMAMIGEAARAAYGEDPAHDVWVEAYAKVRVPGTTTLGYLRD
jgi:hypothetical protein